MTDTLRTESSAGSLTREVAVERAAEIAARLRDRWAEGDELRRLPDATIADLRESGLLRINQPAAYGGTELGIETVLDVGSTIAAGDVATGWAYVILASHAWIIGLFGGEAQHDLWGDDPTVLMSSAFAPKRQEVERVDGGWQLQGEWQWSSGSDHARWAMLGFRVPTGDPDRPTAMRWGLLPRGDYRVLDDWNTVSLRATGSNSLAVESAFVPDHRTVDPMMIAMGMAPGAEVHPSPLFRLPFSCLGVYLAAPLLGGAKGAHRDFVEYIRTKRHTWTGEEIGKQEPTLIHIGETGARVSAADALLRTAARALDDCMVHGRPGGMEWEFGLGRDNAFAVRLCVDAVDECMRWSGGNAIYEGHPANRWWRDVRGLSAHYGFNTDAAYGNVGRALMGLPPSAGVFG